MRLDQLGTWQGIRRASLGQCATKTQRSMVVLATLFSCMGCSESHAVIDMGPMDMGQPDLPACGFLADGECPSHCLGIPGVRAAALPTECVTLEATHFAWCADPTVPVGFAYACRVFPSGEVVILSTTPPDLPEQQRCDITPSTFCGR